MSFIQRAFTSQTNGLAVAATAALVLATVGCGRVNPTSPDTEKLPEGTPCSAPTAVISDGEDNNNQVELHEGRGGYWYTFVDDSGSTVWPEAGAHGGTFEMSPGGANGTKYAARMHGSVGTGSVLFVGMGMNFVDPKGQYDASKYGGISFWAKRGPGSTNKVRIKVPDMYTDPDGGACSECFNDFGMDLTLTEEWQKYTIPFYAMKQQKGWGKPRKRSIDPTTLYGIQFQVSEPGQKFDVYVDEIQFTGCGG
ncbi:MAG: hypothetical protein GX607_06085 [Myxococcales bacterium]|jgi:endoglucanase|nr:hypothetical protein [Myxococcales bacterium]